MLTVDEIRTWIHNDSVSRKKLQAQKGVQYYEGEHDIRNYRIFFVNAEGEVEEDKTKSNIKICHPFFTEIVDQSVQYLLSGDAFIKSDIPELQKILDERFNDNEDFMKELYECVTGSQVKGLEYMYAYKNEEGKTVFECADSMGVVEVRAKDTQDHCDYLIYWYIDRIDKDSKTIKRIQVWDKAQTYFYCQVDNDEIKLDDSVELNPRPHTVYKKPGDESTYYEDYGFIPFFRLDNGKKQFSALKPIKSLIDDYDLMNCGLSNNIQDTQEALYVVKNYQGENLDELMMNIKAKKHIGVSEDGGVEVQTVAVPVEARRAKMEVDEQNIYRFGFGLNTHALKDTAATTNIAIKSAYSLLDLKTNKLQIWLKQFLRKLFKPVLEEVNSELKSDYRQSDIYFDFEPEIPTNAVENAQIDLTEAQTRQTEINTILNLAQQLDNETMMQLVCEQLDINYEDIKDKLPDPDDMSPYEAQIDAVVPEDAGGDGLNE